MKSVVHTGANNQFGGLKYGLFKLEYHVLMEFEVSKDPIKPTNKGIDIDITSFPKFIIEY